MLSETYLCVCSQNLTIIFLNDYDHQVLLLVCIGNPFGRDDVSPYVEDYDVFRRVKVSLRYITHDCLHHSEGGELVGMFRGYRNFLCSNHIHKGHP